MRKVLAAAALAGSIAVTGLAVAPAAQAATATQAGSSSSWGKYYSSDHKAYTFGRTYKSHGKVYTHWYGRESSPRFGYVWFKYYSQGGWHQFSKSWNGSHDETWSGRGIKKIYTWTCWDGKFKNCGGQHRIY